MSAITFDDIPHLPLEENITDQESHQLDAAFENLCNNFRTQLNDKDKIRLKRAYWLARHAHSRQRRKSGELYMFHPIEVARICIAELGLGPNSAIAALLHDTVEDTPVTLEDLENEFGTLIASVVDGLTKFSALTNVRDYMIESPQAENFKKILLTISKDVRVVLVKIADRLHNMRTLGSMPEHKQYKIASETTFLYAPLAHRLGFYNIKAELEDLCMRVIDHENYDYIIQKLRATEKERGDYIKQFTQPIQERVEAEDSSLDFEIFGRVKSVSSIANKLKKKQIPFEEIYDIFAVRIILDVPKNREKSACWNVYSIVTDFYTPVPERLKDWISTPKSNGYESLHTTVMGPKGRFVEVQIRSKRMNDIAERGYAAHWRYKGVGQQERIYENWLSKARELLDNPSSDAIDFLNDFKSNLFAEEVYVFTPKGELRTFPKGATALDFAFDIHSEVGQHCKAVKVDQKIVPLSYELRNGDQIAVITSNSQKPNDDWLKIVKTAKARNKIRQALKDEKIRQGAFGKEALERKLKSMKLLSEENIDTLVKYYQMENRLDLYHAIFKEQIDLGEIKKLQVDNSYKILLAKNTDNQGNASSDKNIRNKISVTPATRRRKFKNKPKLLIDGDDASQYSYSLAACCNPVLGDSIFAYVTSHSGIKIHRSTCPNAEFLQATFGYRIKRAEWVDSAGTSFIAELLVTGMDDLGVVQHLSDIITNQLGINMRSFSMSGNEGHFEGKISVVVKSKDELILLIKEIKKLEEVNTVARIE